MADPSAPFSLKSDRRSGHGALDDFGVHPLSLINILVGPLTRVFARQQKPYAIRPEGEGRRSVETFDIADILFDAEGGIAGSILLNRSAWGRKGRIAVQIFGSGGTLAFDQERMNELQLYQANGPAGEQGFRTILSAPHHPPYDRFIPAPGHGLGFNDLKIIEAHELLRRIRGEKAHLIEFAQGIAIERAVDAMGRSHAEGRWVDLQ